MIKLSDNVKCDNELLRKSYKEALKNNDFKNYVEKLKIDDNILMKYTSTLEDSSIEYNNCLKCKGLNECKNKMIGYAYLPKIIKGNLIFSYKTCRYKESQNNKYSYLKNVKYYNLPELFKEASFDNIDKRYASRKDVILWLNKFINNPEGKGLYLNGNFGCGKTYMITATFNELAKKSIKSSIVFWPEFLRDLKSSFNTNYEEKLDYIKKVKILLIDDIGAETSTTWSRDEILCSILQYRMDNNLTTFMTSNLSLENLEEHLKTTRDGIEIVKAKRIIERIKYLMEEKVMIGKNMRNR